MFVTCERGREASGSVGHDLALLGVFLLGCMSTDGQRNRMRCRPCGCSGTGIDLFDLTVAASEGLCWAVLLVEMPGPLQLSFFPL